MGNIELRMGQELTFCHVQVLERYIFDEKKKYLFFPSAIAQSFLKKKIVKISCFISEMRKRRGKVDILMFMS